MGFLRLVLLNVRDSLLALRGRVIDRALSGIYGAPMRATPVTTAGGQVGVAGAVVLWFMQDGFRHYVMVKNDKTDPRARFVSSLGFGGYRNMGEALRAAVKFQLGDVFARTLGDGALSLDRVAAAPVFSLTDETTGVATPVQSLVWVVQIQQAQTELIMAGPGCVPVMVPEFGLVSNKVSPTHRALVESVRRQLPKLKNVKADPTPEQIEDAVGVIGSGGRILH